MRPRMRSHQHVIRTDSAHDIVEQGKRIPSVGVGDGIGIILYLKCNPDFEHGWRGLQLLGPRRIFKQNTPQLVAVEQLRCRHLRLHLFQGPASGRTSSIDPVQIKIESLSVQPTPQRTQFVVNNDSTAQLVHCCAQRWEIAPHQCSLEVPSSHQLLKNAAQHGHQFRDGLFQQHPEQIKMCPTSITEPAQQFVVEHDLAKSPVLHLSGALETKSTHPEDLSERNIRFIEVSCIGDENYFVRMKSCHLGKHHPVMQRAGTPLGKRQKKRDKHQPTRSTRDNISDAGTCIMRPPYSPHVAGFDVTSSKAALKQRS